MKFGFLVLAGALSACGDPVKTDERSKSNASSETPTAVPTEFGALSLTGVTLDNVCSSSLNSDPGCATYCGVCGGAAMAAYQKSINDIGMGFTALNSGIGTLSFAVYRTTKERIKALDAITCVHGAINAATQVGAACLNASCANWSNINQMAKVQGALAAGASCFAGFDFVLKAVPGIGQIAFAHSVASSAAAYLTCSAPNTQGVLGASLGVQGAQSACQDAILAARPITQGPPCPLQPSQYVQGCTATTPKRPRYAKIYDVQQGCTKFFTENRFPDAPQGYTGTCIADCVKGTMKEIWAECPQESFGMPDY